MVRSSSNILSEPAIYRSFCVHFTAGATVLQDNHSFDEAKLQEAFAQFDTDENGLIDALEMFITLALVSGTLLLQYPFNTFGVSNEFMHPLFSYGYD